MIAVAQCETAAPPQTCETWRLTVRGHAAEGDGGVYVMKQSRFGGSVMVPMTAIGPDLWQVDMDFTDGVYRLRHYTHRDGSYYLGSPNDLHAERLGHALPDVFVTTMA